MHQKEKHFSVGKTKQMKKSLMHDPLLPPWIRTWEGKILLGGEEEGQRNKKSLR